MYNFCNLYIKTFKMKKILLITSMIFFIFLDVSAQVYEFDFVTVIESIVPGGAGRSRMIAKTESVDFSVATTIRKEDGKKIKKRINKKNLRTYSFEETKLLNFYNLGGIRLNNIATNDAMIKSKLNKMSVNGWELFSVSSAVESSGDKDPNGIFITRYLFRKKVTSLF